MAGKWLFWMVVVSYFAIASIITIRQVFVCQ